MTREQRLAEWEMSEYDIIEMLYNFGHFFSPDALAVDLVHFEDLPSLTLDDKVVRAAARSYQRYFKPDLDQLTMRGEEYGGFRRPSIADGDVNGNTIELFTLPRCGHPDFYSPEAGMAEANWPTSCRNEITTSFRMALTGLTAAQVADAWQSADARWARELEVGFVFAPESYPNTRIYAFAQRMGGSVLADQYLAQNNCNSRLQGRFDTRTWSAALFETVTVHEHGHALGIGHLSDPNATMYPSIHQASLKRLGHPVASDIAAAVALGYKRRTSEPPPPPPPPPPVRSITLSHDTPAGTYPLTR